MYLYLSLCGSHSQLCSEMCLTFHVLMVTTLILMFDETFYLSFLEEGAF